MDPKEKHTATQAIHSGAYTDTVYGSVSTPIYPSSTFLFEEPDQPPFFNYARCNHPTREALQQNLAALEKGTRAWACVSGMAAIQVVLTTLSAGDHVVCAHDAYAGTLRLFRRILSRLGIEFSYPDLRDPENLRKALRPNTRLIWIESPSNPAMNLTDLAAVAGIARERGILTAVDNTFLSPVFQRPIEHGIDLVVHSTTKFLNGHSDVIGGAIISGREELNDDLEFIVSSTGVGQSAFDAWLVLRGIRTLWPRMRQHQDNASRLASWLTEQEGVKAVYYPGLESHPQHALAVRQQDGPGGMLSFDLDPACIDPARMVKGTRLFKLAVSLGGVESLIEIPETMSHASLSIEERRAAGFQPETIRLSPGLEYFDDLRDDLAQAMASARK